MVFPCLSVIVTIVLLKLACICAVAYTIFFTVFLRVLYFLAIFPSWFFYFCWVVGFFLTPICRFGPFRVRALVWVLCPRTGRPLLCLRPRYEPISIKRLIFWVTSLRRSPSTLYSFCMCK